ncbi:MAG: 23S rRNA pseudouridine(955/2504/2580) synthase RluC [Methylococcus sp.]|nr:23S rRNA pseudouridine(955/2504/2580) synthase RluC [Methylococcus sp.]
MKPLPEEPNQARLIEVDAETAGQRVDNFLFSRLKGVPKSHVYRILRTGQVRINGGRSKAQQRLNAGDVVRVPPVRVAVAPEPESPAPWLKERLESRMLYEDEDILVVNKPPGMAVHGGSGLSFGVIEGLRAVREGARFLELVHRLDRDTSGCLLIAKRRSMLRQLHEQFRGDGVDKTYCALFAGSWARKRQSVDAPLLKNVLQSGERMVKVSAQGKEAVTEFRRLESLPGATLVEAKPVTGRTHQIRVHAKFLGHPLAGDERYGEAKANLTFRQQGLKRLFLHAATLEFTHPRTGRSVRVEAPLEADLAEFLAAIRI